MKKCLDWRLFVLITFSFIACLQLYTNIHVSKEIQKQCDEFDSSLKKDQFTKYDKDVDSYLLESVLWYQEYDIHGTLDIKTVRCPVGVDFLFERLVFKGDEDPSYGFNWDFNKTILFFQWFYTPSDERPSLVTRTYFSENQYHYYDWSIRQQKVFNSERCYSIVDPKLRYKKGRLTSKEIERYLGMVKKREECLDRVWK